MAHAIRQPLRFQPFPRPMVWGGRRLARFLGKGLPGTGTYGESWEVSDHPLHESRLATASSFGATLRQLLCDSPVDLLGPAAKRYTAFPWLIKLLDANDWLSVQVHPDDKTVAKLWPHEAAKTEAWFILDAEPTSRIYAGLKEGVGPLQLRKGLEAGTVTDCLHEFTPRAGDFLYLPAGTVHALGGGILLAEIQQTSDTTFRLFDWNRRDSQGELRTLHIEESFASIHWDMGPRDPIPTSTDKQERTRLVASPYFEIEHVVTSAPFEVGGVGRLQAIIVVSGQGRFPNGEFFMSGDVWILPAAMPALELHLDSAFVGLLCSLPG